jgi:hypothetical protein
MQQSNGTIDWDHYEKDNSANSVNTVPSSSIYNLNVVLNSINSDFARKHFAMPIHFNFTHQDIAYHSIITEEDGHFTLELRCHLIILPYSAENLIKRQFILNILRNYDNFSSCKITKNSNIELIIKTVFAKKEKNHPNRPLAKEITKVTLITLLDISEKISDMIKDLTPNDINHKQKS